MKKFGYIVLCIALLVIGFVIGRANIPTPFNAAVDTATDQAQETVGTQTDTTTDVPGTTNTTSVPEGGIPVSGSLSAGQRAMLESFGLNPDEFVLTPEMVACAETKLGASRMAEIQGGATPTFLEGASLVACYQ